MNNATREVFGNISPTMQRVFYAMIWTSIALMFFQIWQRSRLWRKGQPAPIEKNPRVILHRLLVYALAQKRVRRNSLGGFLHLLLFSGFLVLTLGTTLLAIAHYGPVNFHHGWYFLIYELTMDTFGLAFTIGCVLALYRRAFARPTRLGHQPSDYFLLTLILFILITGFLINALRLRYQQVSPEIAHWSPIAWLINITLLHTLQTLLTLHTNSFQKLHLLTWWIHTISVAIFFAIIPRTRIFHMITGPLNIALRPQRHAGALAPVDSARVEETGQIGVGQLSQFNRQQLLSTDACMECGRCDDVCPALASHKPLSPKQLILDLRHAMESGTEETLVGQTIQQETLWSCTMCQACVHECPVFVGHVDLISDMRRFMVGEGQFAGPPAKSMRNISSQFNPYGRPNTERFAWADGLDIPTVETNPNFEYLFWAGCAASFDPRAQKIARATSTLFKEAGLNFAVLGQRERCTGDPARRIGDELLFQDLARENIMTMKKFNVTKIVTPCPHCMNTLQNEYSQFDGKYQVVHHSQLLAQLLEEGKLAHSQPNNQPVTLHDPCYLSRVNNETKSTRACIEGDLKEMPRHGKKTFCCGAGGGRMWFDEAPEHRVSNIRATEAISTGAKTLATACPFCLNMMTDGMASTPGGESVKVMDISELLINGRPTKPINA
jgi:Fe-S oxidoreductase/nitrate reductase gamma subunit